MNSKTLTGYRDLWAAATQGRDESYRLLNEQGRVVMFGLTKERAEQYARLYRGAQVVKE